MLAHTNSTTGSRMIASGVGARSGGLRPAATTVLLSLFILANRATASPSAAAAVTLDGTTRAKGRIMTTTISEVAAALPHEYAINYVN